MDADADNRGDCNTLLVLCTGELKMGRTLLQIVIFGRSNERFMVVKCVLGLHCGVNKFSSIDDLPQKITIEPHHKKTVFGVSDQVRLKPSCSATEAS